MALCTAVIDADTGKPRAIRWGWWHVDCMTEVARAHLPETRDLPTLDVWSVEALWNGLTVEYPMGFKDPVDGEVFILNTGDRLNVWRDR